MSQYDRSQETEEAMSLEAPGTHFPDYEPSFGAPVNWASWIDILFMETMRYVPFSRVSKAIWIYRCLDCGKSTSSGLHCR